MIHDTHPWRPRFVFGTGGDVVDWAGRWPMRPWDRRTATVGGSRTAAGGMPAAYVVRRDRNLMLTLRVDESEIDTLEDLVQWGQGAENFLFYPDANDDTTSVLVYLEDPQAGTDLQGVRSTEYPRVIEHTIQLRPVNPTRWTMQYFPTC